MTRLYFIIMIGALMGVTLACSDETADVFDKSESGRRGLTWCHGK